jgi:hypothetical protein
MSGPDALISHSRLAGWGAWRRSVLLIATVRRLRALELDAVLLTVVALVRTVAVIPVIVVCRSGVRRCGSAVVVVVVVGLRIVVTRSGSPASAVEGCATSLAPTTSSEAAVHRYYMFMFVECSHSELRVHAGDRGLTCRGRREARIQSRQLRGLPIAPRSSRQIVGSTVVDHSGQSCIYCRP